MSLFPVGRVGRIVFEPAVESVRVGAVGATGCALGGVGRMLGLVPRMLFPTVGVDGAAGAETGVAGAGDGVWTTVLPRVGLVSRGGICGAETAGATGLPG